MKDEQESGRGGDARMFTVRAEEESRRRETERDADSWTRSVQAEGAGRRCQEARGKEHTGKERSLSTNREG